MAVLNYREILPRTFSHRFGESPTATRVFNATLDGPTATQDILNAIGVVHGSAHPEFAYLLCTNGDLNETDRYHAEVTCSYEVPKEGTEDYDVNPLSRPDVWSFSTGGAQVPALTYYHGNGNADIRPLQNTANEYIEGVTTLEAEVRATIASNRSAFPLATAAAVTNTINNATFLGGAQYTWQCAGISGQQTTEVVNGAQVRYWQVSVELVYRASGWPLKLPNVGWNYLEGGQLKRAWVRDPDDPSIKVASSVPRALDDNGNLKPEGQSADILGGGAGLRVFPSANFQTYFGTPPF
jgi:hypothetical protein